MASPKEQEKQRELLYATTRSILAAIMSVGVQTAAPKGKPESIIQRSLVLADILLQATNARDILDGWVPEAPPEIVVKIKEYTP